MRYSTIAALALAALPLGSASAIPITDAQGLSADDFAKIANVEAIFFNSVENVGAEQTAVLFAQASGVSLPDDFRGEAKKLDSFCGKPTKVERTNYSNSGNSYASRKYTTTHPNCLIYWVIDFNRTAAGWGIAYFNFNSDARLAAAG